MPKLRPSPREGLPFGPGGIEFTQQGRGPLMLPGERELGYILSRSRTRNAGGPIFVDWLVTAKLARIDRRGGLRKKLGWRREHVTHVGRDDPTHLIFQPPRAPGFYRLEVVFRNGAQRRIGRFGEYIRVLRPSLNVRLSLNQSSFKPGDRVVPRLENYGAAYLFFGLIGAYYEHYDGVSWGLASFGNGPKPAIGLGIGPGASASCWAVQIPENASPGRYRFSLRAGYNYRRFSNQGNKTLSAEFDVTG
jgi:hypothetical protein